MAESNLRRRAFKSVSEQNDSQTSGSSFSRAKTYNTRLYLTVGLVLLLLAFFSPRTFFNAPSPSLASQVFPFDSAPSSSPSHGTTIPSDSPLYRIQHLPNRGGGYGVIASRTLLPGTVLMKESPAFQFSAPQHQTPQQAAQMIQNLFARLDDQDQQKILALSNAWEGRTLTPLLGIIQTNAMAAMGKTALFPTIARINHACAGSTNAVYRWNEEEQKQEVRIVKKVEEGQEVFLSYWDSKVPKRDRQKHLMVSYGFMCTCHTCQLGNEESKISDERLLSIKRLRQYLGSWANDQLEGKHAITVIEAIANLMNLEGISYEFGQLYADATRVASSHSDAEATKYYATLAAQHFALELGQDANETRELKMIAEKPQLAPFWATKKVETVQ